MNGIQEQQQQQQQQQQQPPPELPKFKTAEEVAELFRTTVDTIRHWRTTGYGPPFVRIGKRVLYRVDALETWIQSQTDNPSATLADETETGVD